MKHPKSPTSILNSGRFASVFAAAVVLALVVSACAVFSRGETGPVPDGTGEVVVEATESPAPAPAAEIAAPLVIPPAPDYANPSSWLSSGETNSILPEFEVFYIYPTLFQNKLRPVMDHRFDRIRVKAADYLKLTFGLLTDPVHPFKLYAPFVRQADYGTALETDFAGDLGETLFRYGIEDTKTAFLYFLERFHTPGMPYILIGHSQGASDLYELLRSTPEITPESGFVAAYLAGLPKKTAAEVDRDFAGRGIRRGTKPGETGVILSWNTLAPGAGDNMLATPGGCVVNPLTWSSKTTPAGESDLPETGYYYVSEKEPAGEFDGKLLAGTRADPARGAVIVELPGDSEFDASGAMGEGVFHMNDLFFFAESVRDDMIRRAAAWRKSHPAED